MRCWRPHPTAELSALLEACEAPDAPGYGAETSGGCPPWPSSPTAPPEVGSEVHRSDVQLKAAAVLLATCTHTKEVTTPTLKRKCFQSRQVQVPYLGSPEGDWWGELEPAPAPCAYGVTYNYGVTAAKRTTDTTTESTNHKLKALQTTRSHRAPEATHISWRGP